MTLSRKEFFRQGFYSLGETLLSVGATLREAQGALRGAPAAQPESGAELPEGEAPLAEGTDLVARVDNRHCMAKNCGCLSCLECCEAGAISLVLGEGIVIDAALCTGCGDCYRLCPLAPWALALVSRP